MISLETQVSAAPGVLVRELDGEAVLLNVQTEQYYGLDEVGTRMWAVLTGSSSIQAALETLLAEYEVDAATLERDLLQLAQDLVAADLLVVQ
jgi:hypothetical protein